MVELIVLFGSQKAQNLDRDTQEKLRQASGGGVLDPGGYYKVAWTEALDLVGKKKVYMCRGEAYVGRKDLVSIIVAKFRARLSRMCCVCVEWGVRSTGT